MYESDEEYKEESVGVSLVEERPQARAELHNLVSTGVRRNIKIHNLFMIINVIEVRGRLSQEGKDREGKSDIKTKEDKLGNV